RGLVRPEVALPAQQSDRSLYAMFQHSLRDDLQRLSVGGSVGMEMTVQREDPAYVARLRRRDKRGVRQIHRGVPVLGHERPHPLLLRNATLVDDQLAGGVHLPERLLTGEAQFPP